MIKKSIEDEINSFLNHFEVEGIADFLMDVLPLIELYNVDDENDWVRDKVGEDQARDIRLIRTAYLLSRVCHFHAGKLLSINVKHRDLWKKMEKTGTIKDGDVK